MDEGDARHISGPVGDARHISGPVGAPDEAPMALNISFSGDGHLRIGSVQLSQGTGFTSRVEVLFKQRSYRPTVSHSDASTLGLWPPTQPMASPHGHFQAHPGHAPHDHVHTTLALRTLPAPRLTRNPNCTPIATA